MDLIKSGLVWRFGNGRSIRIWRDKCLPSPSSYQVQTTVNTLAPKATVDELIDEDLRCWKKELVE